MNDFNNTLPDTHSTLSMRFIEAGPLLIAGLCEPLTTNSHETIPLLWQQLARRIAEIPDRIDSVGYGLCINNRGYHYMAGYAVWDVANLPPGIHHAILPAQHYAVFSHPGHVIHIRNTIDEVFDHWLPNSDYTLNISSSSPLHFFERYGKEFNPITGTGDIEIWLPIQHKAP